MVYFCYNELIINGPFIPTINLPIRNSWHGKKTMACRRFHVVGHTSEELKDVGVSVEALDKEGLVQAVVQQLS